MLRFQWNALHVGDQVRVHDDRDPRSPLVDGVVTVVESYPGGRDVAIRLPGSATPVHPRRLSVHLIEFVPNDTCWRCEALAA